MRIPLTNTETDVNMVMCLLKCLKLSLAPSYMVKEYGLEIYRNDTYELVVNFVKHEIIIKELSK